MDLAGHLFGSLSEGWELDGREVHIVEVLYVLSDIALFPLSTYG